MAIKRKLVEILPVRHDRLEQIRGKQKKRGLRVPTIPALVDRALEIGIPYVEGELMPPAPEPKRGGR